jgi:hypothetical protein
VAQARVFAELVKHGLYARFRHLVQYDNAPSHKKTPPGAAVLSNMAKSDGCGKVRLRDTTFGGAVFRMSLPREGGEEEDFVNKGLRTIGFERDYWNEAGHDVNGKKLSKADMIQQLAKDLDFSQVRQLCKDFEYSQVKSILEEFYETQPHVQFILNAKFWCDLQWVEQYWNDVKREVRELCDYTLPTLKKQFPISLASVPIKNIRNYQARSFEIMQAMRVIGRDGDFGRIPGLRKEYKSQPTGPEKGPKLSHVSLS